ncbi:MAG: TRAP transporter large permease subunit [Rhodospirillales bacterium]|nr:TRAP transporter large permease subunit [Rhodospirillales bacterium]
MFPSLLLILFLGVHVAITMMGLALIFGYIAFGPSIVYQLVQKVDGTASNYVLAAVPLFVFMGSMLERSGIADRLFEAIHIWTRRLPGGLAIGTILMCVVFAASTGVIGATETVVGLLAIPVMLKYNYDKALISGTICAGGSLGTIIPPSVVVVVLGPVADVSVGDLMYGMLFPGLIMAGLYVVYIFFLCLIKPEAGRRIPPGDDDPPLAEKLRITAIALVPPFLLIFAVLGSLILGWAAPTEAAGLGALGALLMALGYGRFTWTILHESVMKTLRITCMIMMILLAGSMFAGVFLISGGLRMAEQFVAYAQLGPWGLLGLFLFLAFIAGFILEWISILLILIPIFIPLLKAVGFDPIWVCVLFLVMIQTSYLTPPMAPAIFYLRGISPPEITIHHMYKGVVPFIGLQVLTMAIVMIWPETVLWLPEKLLSFR